MSDFAARLRATFVTSLFFVIAQPAAAQVFINEIHYDNDGGDTGESIEIAGLAGTDLSGWSIIRYNGNGGASYGTDVLSGVLVNQQGGFGTLVIDYPSNGLQNGAPDGIALVDAGNVVVQFLSYAAHRQRYCLCRFHLGGTPGEHILRREYWPDFR